MSGLKVKMFARTIWLWLGLNHHPTADLFVPLFSGSELKRRVTFGLFSKFWKHWLDFTLAVYPDSLKIERGEFSFEAIMAKWREGTHLHPKYNSIHIQYLCLGLHDFINAQYL